LRFYFVPVELREWKGKVTKVCRSEEETTLRRLCGNAVNQVHPILDAFAKLRQATVSFVMSVRPSARMEQLRSTGRIFIKKFDIEWLSDIC
jgi:hypothetical protein